MSTAAAGCISLVEELLRTTLADVTAFRTWAGAADRAAALARIYNDGLPPPADGDCYTPAELAVLRPYAVVFLTPQRGIGFQMDGIGDGYEYSAAGSLTVRLYQTCPSTLGDEPTSDANRRFKNSVGQILDGLRGLAGLPGYLDVREISLAFGPYWPAPTLVESQGFWQAAELAIAWKGI